MDSSTEELGAWFDYIWGLDLVADKESFVYLPIKEDDGSERGRWQAFMFAWPRQRSAVIKHVLKWNATPSLDVYYCPALFKFANPARENVRGSWVLWVDFDGNAPESWPTELTKESPVPRPTAIIQSSVPGHEHCYWKLSEFLADPTVLEERNRSLAYAMHADTSGWDADQILRPPHTTNRKRDAEVLVKEWSK